MKLYFFANWKMYLDEAASAELAAEYTKIDLPDVETAIFPSALALSGVRRVLSGSKVGLGAQNGYWVDKGGYTGEVSIEMYKKSGCQFVLVGHSERRYVFGETDEDVSKKMAVILENDLTPVLCVGETDAQREAGQTQEVVKKQLTVALSDLDSANTKGKKIFVAYEPVWAIGTGQDCSAAEAGVVHQAIDELCRELQPEVEFIYLYGGSVNEENVTPHVADPHVDGVLVGTSSTKSDKVIGITQAMQDYLKN